MKRILGLLVLALGVALLSSCGAAPPLMQPQDGKVELFLTVHPEGSVTTDLFLNGMADSTAERVRIGEQVGRLLLPDAPSLTAAVAGDGLRSSNVTATAAGYYLPGPRPEIRLDSTGATRWLLDHGAGSVAVFVSAPKVAVQAAWAPPPQPGSSGVNGDPWTWGPVTAADMAPTGVLRLQPQPWNGVVTLLGCLLAWLALAVCVVAAVRQLRALAYAAAVVPLAALCALVMWPDLAGTIDNLGVSGHIGGAVLEVVRHAPASLVVPAVAAFPVALLAARRASQRERGHAHTG